MSWLSCVWGMLDFRAWGRVLESSMENFIWAAKTGESYVTSFFNSTSRSFSNLICDND